MYRIFLHKGLTDPNPITNGIIFRTKKKVLEYVKTLVYPEEYTA